MVELSELDAAGNTTGPLDRLYANPMTVGSKVAHDRVKGTYEIAEVIQSDAGPAIKLRLYYKCINMAQLWGSFVDSSFALAALPEVAEVLEVSPMHLVSKAAAKPRAKARAEPGAADAPGADLRATAASETADSGATAAAEEGREFRG